MPLFLYIYMANIYIPFQFKINIFANFLVGILEAREPVVEKDPNSVKLWTRLPIGTVKMNVDVAILSDKCWLVVFARDDRGNIVKYWSKVIPPK